MSKIKAWFLCINHIERKGVFIIEGNTYCRECRDKYIKELNRLKDMIKEYM